MSADDTTKGYWWSPDIPERKWFGTLELKPSADLADRKVVTNPVDLIRLNEKVAIVFQSCVLSDIGIPPERFCRLRRQMATEIVQY